MNPAKQCTLAAALLGALAGTVWAQVEGDDPNVQAIVQDVSQSCQELSRQSSSPVGDPTEAVHSGLADALKEFEALTNQPPSAKPAVSISHERAADQDQGSGPKPQATVEPNLPDAPQAKDHGSGSGRTIPTDILDALAKETPADAPAAIRFGDELYRAGALDEAAVVYGMAARGEMSDEDASWVAMQTGNCRFRLDSDRARAAYTRLLGQYPSSPWAEITKLRLDLLDWYEANDPEKAVKDSLKLIAAVHDRIGALQAACDAGAKGPAGAGELETHADKPDQDPDSGT